MLTSLSTQQTSGETLTCELKGDIKPDNEDGDAFIVLMT